ncbi:hypothetical protein LXL04_033287 [Taraxacum kok-saghyz]
MKAPPIPPSHHLYTFTFTSTHTSVSLVISLYPPKRSVQMEMTFQAQAAVAVVLVVLYGRITAATWCVVRSEASREALQAALDYACAAGADCAPIQQNGLCFLPNTIQAHASYAFNSYYMRRSMAAGSCEFGGTATIAKTDPSYGSCVYPASPSTDANGAGIPRYPWGPDPNGAGITRFNGTHYINGYPTGSPYPSGISLPEPDGYLAGQGRGWVWSWRSGTGMGIAVPDTTRPRLHPYLEECLPICLRLDRSITFDGITAGGNIPTPGGGISTNVNTPIAPPSTTTPPFGFNHPIGMVPTLGSTSNAKSSTKFSMSRIWFLSMIFIVIDLLMFL